MDNRPETDIDEEINPEAEPDGKKPKKPLLRSSFESAFSHTDQVSALRYLVETGEEVRGLLLRTAVPSKRNDGVVLAIAMANCLAKCREFGDEPGEQEILDMLALLPSVDGYRIKQLVEAIIGERQSKDEKDFSNKIKKLAFGDRGG